MPHPGSPSPSDYRRRNSICVDLSLTLALIPRFVLILVPCRSSVFLRHKGLVGDWRADVSALVQRWELDRFGG